MERLAIAGRGPHYVEAIDSGCEDLWVVQSATDLLNVANKIFCLHEHENIHHELRLRGKVVLTINCLPTARLRGMFGDYFHSSIAWMLGYAILFGYKHIELYGVDMSTRGEYGYQRDGLSRLIGKAEAFGAKVIIPRASQMYLPPALYGMSKEVQDAIQEQETRRLHENQ